MQSFIETEIWIAETKSQSGLIHLRLDHFIRAVTGNNHQSVSMTKHAFVRDKLQKCKINKTTVGTKCLVMSVSKTRG